MITPSRYFSLRSRLSPDSGATPAWVVATLTLAFALGLLRAF